MYGGLGLRMTSTFIKLKQYLVHLFIVFEFIFDLSVYLSICLSIKSILLRSNYIKLSDV